MGLYGSKDQHPKLVDTSAENDRLASLQWQYCEKCGNKHLQQYKKCPACGHPHRKKLGIVGKCWLCILIVLCAVIIGVYNGIEFPTSDGASDAYKYVAVKSKTPPRVVTPEQPNTSPAMTMGEQNALKSAQRYLSFTNFSYNGLIEQLEYEKYTHEEAVFAADHCGADWYEQASGSARKYLNISAFSKEGLIQQLEFEGYTREQAEYGVKQNGYD